MPDARRVIHTAALFGFDFSRRLEPFVFTMAEQVSPGYHGGYWQFYTLSNGGFFMAPQSDASFPVTSQNGLEGQLPVDAFGITVCLYAYSHLSFPGGGRGSYEQACAEQYHLLRDYMFGHPEAGEILRDID